MRYQVTLPTSARSRVSCNYSKAVCEDETGSVRDKEHHVIGPNLELQTPALRLPPWWAGLRGPKVSFCGEEKPPKPQINCCFLDGVRQEIGLTRPSGPCGAQPRSTPLLV